MGQERAFLSVGDGIFLLNATRDVILSYLRDKSWAERPIFFPQSLARKQGAFVSIVEKVARETSQLEKYVLSIGHPLLDVSLIDNAISAATKAAIDLSSDSSATLRLSTWILRIDVVGDLERLEAANPMKYLELIRVGSDGLMVERGHYKGVLLPQVPIAEKWTAQDFLSQCCMRAGLMADAWLQKVVRIYRFQTQVFESKLEN